MQNCKLLPPAVPWEFRAKAELELRRRARNSLPLLDFIPALTPRWRSPRHLKAVTDLFERAMHKQVFACVSVPPRHAKTETILHAFAKRLAQCPQDTLAYASYAIDFSLGKSKMAREYARSAGVRIRQDASAAAEWRTPEGGGMLATGIGGQLTGKGCQLLVVDDPHKSRAEAESPTIRNSIAEWFRGTAFTRVEPGGSIIVVHTRWHPDDLIGTLERDTEIEWEIINLPAVSDDGEPLWPDQWSLEALEVKRRGVGDYDWASQYQGRPRPKGGAVFNDTCFYDALPDKGYRVGIGIDLSYSGKTYSDHSVAVVLLEKDGICYVADVVRMQCEAPVFAQALKQILARYPGVRPRWHRSGTEMGTAQLFAQLGVRIDDQPAIADKFVRSQPVSVAWNAHQVLLPRGEQPWIDPFAAEVLSFTGVGDKHDDQVDALASAYDALIQKPVARGVGQSPVLPF